MVPQQSSGQFNAGRLLLSFLHRLLLRRFHFGAIREASGRGDDEVLSRLEARRNLHLGAIVLADPDLLQMRCPIRLGRDLHAVLIENQGR
jgi:hypothetical protein